MKAFVHSNAGATPWTAPAWGLAAPPTVSALSPSLAVQDDGGVVALCGYLSSFLCC
jgi:hypothetical protein